MVVGFQPCFDFGFVVDYFTADFVVGEDVVVAEVLERIGYDGQLKLPPVKEKLRPVKENLAPVKENFAPGEREAGGGEGELGD